MLISELNEYQLKKLYFNFVAYRDSHCNGWAKISIHDFLRKYGLNAYVQN
jgi:hypothetical protein